MFTIYKNRQRQKHKMAASFSPSSKMFKQEKPSSYQDKNGGAGNESPAFTTEKKPATVIPRTLNGIMAANIYLLCPDCIKASRNTEAEITKDGERAIIQLLMCQDCVRLNTHIKLRQREHYFQNDKSEEK